MCYLGILIWDSYCSHEGDLTVISWYAHAVRIIRTACTHITTHMRPHMRFILLACMRPHACESYESHVQIKNAFSIETHMTRTREVARVRIMCLTCGSEMYPQLRLIWLACMKSHACEQYKSHVLIRDASSIETHMTRMHEVACVRAIQVSRADQRCVLIWLARVRSHACEQYESHMRTHVCGDMRASRADNPHDVRASWYHYASILLSGQSCFSFQDKNIFPFIFIIWEFLLYFCNLADYYYYWIRKRAVEAVAWDWDLKWMSMVIWRIICEYILSNRVDMCENKLQNVECESIYMNVCVCEYDKR
jgi:hypothetical protein